MPKINYKLASQRMDRGPGPGGLRPDLLSGASSVSGTRGPQINVNAANTRYTSLPIPKVTIDTTLDSAAQASQVVSQAAFDYAEREAKAQADTMLLDLQRQAKDTLRKYGSLRGQEAAENYETMMQTLRGQAEERLQQLGPSARTKAVLPAKQILNTHLDAAASHRVKQQRAWDEQIILNKENQYIDDLPSLPPENIRTHIENYAGQISREYADRPDFAEAKVKDFTNRAYDTVINSQINLGRLEEADATILEASKHGANFEMLTEKREAVEKAYIQEDRAYTAQYKRRKNAEKIHNEKQMNHWVDRAYNSTDPSMLDNIEDSETRADAYALYDKLQTGVKTSSQPARAAMYRDRGRLIEHPRLVLEDGAYPGVSWNDKWAFYNVLYSERGSQAAQAKTLGTDWIETILPETEQSSLISIGGGRKDKAVAATELRLMDTINEAVDEAVRNDKSPHMALQKAKAQILKDTDQFTHDQIKITKNALEDIEGEPYGEYGFTDSIGMRNAAGRLLENERMPAEAKLWELQNIYVDAGKRLATKYTLPFDALARGDWQTVVSQISSRAELDDLLKDATMLATQFRYYSLVAAGKEETGMSGMSDIEKQAMKELTEGNKDD